ncbi:MAG TPA: hypothetical protein PKE55_03135 [Kiritimatiellia bacterium]|nr:hypothetical protein [Kiritimatiellia bacterium]
MKTKTLFLMLSLGFLLNVRSADGGWRDHPFLRFVVQEIRLDLCEPVVRSIVLQLDDHTGTEPLTLALVNPDRLMTERFPRRFFRRFDDQHVALVPPGVIEVDGFISLRPFLFTSGWPDILVDVYAVVNDDYNRSSTFTLRYQGGRTWSVAGETVHWEGDGGPIVLPWLIDGKPACFTDDPIPEIVPCEPY